MQTNYINQSELAELITDATLLHTLDHEGQITYVLNYGGGDLLATVNPITGGAICVYPCSSFDHEGGSIHDQARSMQ